ncbi:hypothetical protein [Burkholderia sp. Ac-20379]|uniref:hypothetical protein n=1 Tax=Burkholderia sp. Ac-20379 TaxID=2703900 RepID=UPI00197F2067|nr:hypothetical protein [Burkholderia sp. Ac-20379]MBN3723783.1 hypothetical protein [Burkholderia sp. Ac-20379]
MPNVTFYVHAGRMPSDEHLAELSGECVELCTGLLGARLENVHVVYVDVRHGYGHPIFVEIQYRLETFRTPEVMNPFMDALENAIVRHTGLTARIRCFGHAASNVYARH